MSPEKQDHLKNKFPKIFSNNFYFECGDGWFDLLDCLCEDIQSYINWKYKEMPVEELPTVQVEATQVKEKFGGLRFYHFGGDDETNGMISFAESFSYKVCESCGNKGELYKNGWHRTHCEPCEKEYQQKRSVTQSN